MTVATTTRQARPLPVPVIAPWENESPLRFSAGTKPTKDPLLFSHPAQRFAGHKGSGAARRMWVLTQELLHAREIDLRILTGPLGDFTVVHDERRRLRLVGNEGYTDRLPTSDAGETYQVSIQR